MVVRVVVDAVAVMVALVLVVAVAVAGINKNDRLSLSCLAIFANSSPAAKGYSSFRAAVA